MRNDRVPVGLGNLITLGVLDGTRMPGKTRRCCGLKIAQVADLAYRLALPPSMSGVHNVFHVSMLRKYVQDESHAIDYGTIEVNVDTTFVVEPVRILDRSTKQLRRKEVDLVKVLWSHHDMGDPSWELELDMRAKYPQLFVDECA
ncbi:uncharacterized protein LOC133744522 [Rosa rugosa]|uniref:uncharacterized protein LOC133744522 n=1 Tax=Rosa rugosa TaxID=74645 RepID=UPI002B416EC8|nr:uncharacterized protein LOC133744522 [Rosa rugosa]